MVDRKSSRRLAGLMAIILCVATFFVVIKGPVKKNFYDMTEPDFSTPLGISSFKEVVGPADNPYFDPKYYNPPDAVPLEEVPGPAVALFNQLVPEYEGLTIKPVIKEGEPLWSMNAWTSENDDFRLTCTTDGRIVEYRTYIDLKSEVAGRLFEQGSIEEIPIEKIPRLVTLDLLRIQPQFSISKAYIVDSTGGRRYFVQSGNEGEDLIVSLTEEGSIRTAGPMAVMLTPFKPYKVEELSVVEGNLSKYGDRYHVSTMLDRIKQLSIDREKGFRFAVLGDTRSNPIVWKTVLKSISRWEPLFAIDAGDLTPNGYSDTMNSYLFQNLDLLAGFPFLPVTGNHDVRRGSLAYEYSFGGKAARVYSFDVWNCRFVILDNTEYGNQIPWKEQLKMADEWLGEKNSYKKFVFIHSPPHEIEKWAYHSMPARQSKPFVELMSKHSVDNVFCGHIHAFSTASYEGVEYMIVGGGGAGLHSHYGEMGSVHSYVIVDVLPGSVKLRLVRLLPEPDIN